MSQSLHSITASPVPFILTTDTPEELISAVDAITPSAGRPDCRAAVIGGLLAGLGASQNDSVLILYTDAPAATDADLLPAFERMLREKRVRYYYLNLPFDCRPARERSGQAHSSLNEQTASQSLEFPFFSEAADGVDGESSPDLGVLFPEDDNDDEEEDDEFPSSREVVGELVT
jgi:hypothetical protein